MSVLDNIHSPSDVKAVPPEDLSALCAEIREFLIESVSKTGGHLASNLGVVELTVALHRVFDTSKDRMVFDIGHQSYVHKLLTGRKPGFKTLRQTGGLAGFPKPSESIHDAFIAGHASSSISIALGMARARTLSRSEYSVIAIVGDGALTGGTAFEGLSNAGESGERMVIILNDNGMSITNNVGGIANYLSRQRMKPSYAALKKRYRSLTEKLPGGRAVYRFTHSAKKVVKDALLKCSMFEEMGLQYSGPVDGHDINRIVGALEWARRQNEPTVVHVLTQKGKGYEFSEQEPDKYHGVRPFDFRTGIPEKKEKTFSLVFGDELTKHAMNDPRICSITAAMSDGTGLNGFAMRFPERFFDVGIAEGHAAAMAAGLASKGAIPVFAVYSTFLQRAYDMLIHDVAISGLHVIFAVDRAGIVSSDGETHQGVFDAAYLRSIPGMTVFSPSNFAELRDMLDFSLNNISGPVAVRYPRGGEGAYKAGGLDAAKRIREGKDFTLVTYGISINTAVEAAKKLGNDGISVEIVKLGRICPIDMDMINSSVAKTGRLLVLEECVARGSVGEGIAATLAQGNASSLKSVILLNIGERFVPCGDAAELQKLCGIDTESVCGAIRNDLKGHRGQRSGVNRGQGSGVRRRKKRLFQGFAMKKTRLDAALVERGLVESLERAKAVIMCGSVFIGGHRASVPGVQVASDADIRIHGKPEYVSRGGQKLAKALEFFKISPKGKICIDCGASTGGFTDCLLKNGAKKVYAIDVGYGQLAWTLRNDPRVVTMERTNIRYVSAGMFEKKPDFATIDVSFISLATVLPIVRNLLTDDGETVCLIKPQFEAEREKVGEKGVVSDPDTHANVLNSFLISAVRSGFCVKGLTYSPVRGPEGNIEYLCLLNRQGDSEDIEVQAIVSESHRALT